MPGAYSRQRDDRDSHEPLHSGGGFTDEEDYRNLADPKSSGMAKCSAVLNIVLLVAVLAMAGMFYADFSKNYHDNEKLDRLLANQQSLELTEFYQLKVLQGAWGPEVVWPPLFIGEGGLNIPSPTPSPSPSPVGLRRGEENTYDEHAREFVHPESRSKHTLSIGTSLSTGLCESFERYKVRLDDQLEVRASAGKRSDHKTNGEAIYDIDAQTKGGCGNDDDDDDDDECACASEITAAATSIINHVTIQTGNTNSIINTGNTEILHKIEEVKCQVDINGQCCDDNQNLLETIVESSGLVQDEGWPQWTREANGHVFAPPAVSDINLANVQNLTFKCDLSNGPGTKAANAMVSVRGNFAYVTNKDTGDIYCYDRYSCEEVWKTRVEQVFEDHIPASGSDAKVNASISNIPSRHSPALFRTADGQERLIIGAPSDRFGAVMNGAGLGFGLSTYILCLDAHTGEYVWHSKTSDNATPEDFLAHYAGSPTIQGDHVFFGTSSFANVFTLFGLPCTFIGNLAKYSLVDGSLVWKTYTLPTGLGAGSWCGASVWARISVDTELGANGLVISGSGNGHYHPESVETCYTNYTNDPEFFSQASIDCHADAVATYNHPIMTDTAFALDLATGAIVWSFTPGGLDTFNVACPAFGHNPRTGGGMGCQGFKGPDWDFAGSFPIVDFGDHKRVMATSKSGMAWGLNALTGTPYWAQNLGPGGTLGGGHWSGSYNPKTNLFYANNAGDASISGYDGAVLSSYNILTENTWVCNGGTVHAIDVLSGNIVWETYDAHANVSLNGVGTFPSSCWDFSSNSFTVEKFKKAWPRFNSAGANINSTLTATLGVPCDKNTLTGPANLANPTFARLHGVVSVTEEVLAVGSITGNLYMLDASTGNCVHHLACPKGGIYGGAVMVDNQLIVQCGYGTFVPEWIAEAGGNVTRIFELA